MNGVNDSPLRLARNTTGRRAIITIVAVALFLLLFGRLIANFMIDRWWYLALGRSDVFWGRLFAQAGLFSVAFAVFVLVAFVNLSIADRLAPDQFSANVHPVVERFHEIFGRRLRSLRFGAAIVLGIMTAGPAAAMWQEWLLFRRGGSFGIKDPQFGQDVGFYVFRLPLISFVVDWWFAAVFVVTLLTLVAHLLNGGVVLSPPTPSIRRASQNHLAVLVACLALLKALDYVVSRYELTSSRRGFIDGATYTVARIQLPALILLAMVALLTAGLYVAIIRTGRWGPALTASALWLVVAVLGVGVFPGIVESVVVRPNQPQREAPYIERNVSATRAAYGLADVETRKVEFSALSTASVESDLGAFSNVRLLDDNLMLNQFEIDRGEKAGLKIRDLDVDRYQDNGSTTQVMVAARELDLDGVPNTSWPSLHLVNTRGCGLVTAPLGKVTDTDRPVYRPVKVDREQLYFSGEMDGFAIVGTDAAENPCGTAGPYKGDKGVALRGAGRRLAFALAFADYNLLAARGINTDSQVLWHRSVRGRVSRVAPFLETDNDPYPVVVDGGVKWVLDAYTLSTHYPYAQSIERLNLPSTVTLRRDVNYLRNSVKAVVDAYDGSVTLYAMTDSDPVLQAWRRVFPTLLAPLDTMPDELRAHLRYPEDLFTIQTELYSKYHLRPQDFFERVGAWSVAQAPSVNRQDTPTTGGAQRGTDALNRSDSFASESNVARFVPYYTLFPNGSVGNVSGGGDSDFVIFRPFVPFSVNDSRTELQAFMTASSDPDDYGKLTSYVVTNEPKIPGPLRVADQAENDEEISKELTLQTNNESGTKVAFGDIQATPVANGLIYVRPVYVISGESTKISFVIVSHDGATVMTKSVDSALAKLFPGYEGNVADRVGTGGATTGGATTESTVQPTTGGSQGSGGTATVDSLLDAAAKAYEEGQALLAKGDLGGYQSKMDEVGRLVTQANALVDGNSSTRTATTAPTATTVPATTVAP